MQQPSPGPFLALEFLQLLSLANNCIFGTIPLDTGGELVGGRGRAAAPGGKEPGGTAPGGTT